MGKSAVFVSAASGIPVPTLQWQRLAAGSSTWSDLSNNENYAGAANGMLTVTTTALMNGDQFRCVATSLAGRCAPAMPQP